MLYWKFACVRRILFLSTILSLIRMGTGSHTTLRGIFRPHDGFKVKTKYCMRCQVLVDLDKEEHEARIALDKNFKKANMKRTKKHTLAAVERNNKIQMRMKTGDALYGTAEQNAKGQPAMMDIDRKIKDGAVEAAAALPKDARDMVMGIIQNTIAPKSPMMLIPNPAWSKIASKKVPRYIMARVYDKTKGRDNMDGIKKIPKEVKEKMDKDPNLPKPDEEPSENRKKVDEALKQPDKIKAQLIARKAIRIAEAYARNANNIMNNAPAITQKDLKVVDLENKKSKVFLCTHNSLPVDCCTCCKEMSTHCCQFCKAEKEEQRVAKAILTGVNENNDSSENSKESPVRENSALNVQKTKEKERKEGPEPRSWPTKPAANHKVENPRAKLVKTPGKSPMAKPLSKDLQSPKAKVPAPTVPKMSSTTSTPASSETSVPHTKSPTIAERMGVLPSPFKHIPSENEKKQVSNEESKRQMKEPLKRDESGKKEEKQVSNEESKKQMKEPLKRTEKRLTLPPRSEKAGLTKNAEEVECEKEWYMSKTAMSRHQNTHTEYDGGVLPTVLGCMNKKRMEEKYKEEHPDENVNNPENTVDIFPTKINLARACNGDGSPQSAAACLTAKAAVRAKIAALDAVKAAKEGDVEGATEALRNAAMGKSGKAGKSVAEKEREKEEEKDGKNEEEESPTPPSDGLDKTPPNVPKVKPMPKPKEKEGTFNGKNGVPSAGDQGKAHRKSYLPKDIKGLEETALQKGEQEKDEELKAKGPPFMTFLEVMDLWENPPFPSKEESLDQREKLMEPGEANRRQNRKKKPYQHKEAYPEGEGPQAGATNPGEQVDKDEEPNGKTFKLTDLTVCINESSEILARTLLTQLVVDAKLKLICTPARGSRKFDIIDRWKFAGG